ncbi:MAG: site-specific integrase, partial [Oscillospiraceae bacterium]|nr:site-specific integrase [Oscillospiraceae bacterium]
LLNNYVYPHRGTEKLASIKTKDIDDFYHFLLHESEPVTTAGKPRRQHISPSIIHDIHKLLRCAFNQAKRWDYIEKNPFDNATLPEYKEKVRQILTPEQVMQVLEHTDRPDDYNYYVIHCAVQLALAGCMRAGEICGAQWDRLDMPEQVLFVDRTIDRVKKENLKKLTKMDILCELPSLFPGTKSVIVLKQPKTEGSIRNVYIPDTVIKKLQALREMQLQMRIDFGDADYTDYGFIIAQANGRPIMRENLNRHFKKILTEIGPETLAKAEDVVFHSIRHTSTGMKLKLSQGDLKTVQAEGGWSSPDMVTKRYAHIIEEDRKKLAQKMEHSFYGNQKSTQSQQSTSSDVQLLAELIMSNPELLTRAIQSVNSANMSA